MTAVRSPLPPAPSLPRVVGLHAVSALKSLLSKRSWPALATVALLTALTALIASYSVEDRLAATDFFGSFGRVVVALLGIGYGASGVRAQADRGAVTLFLLKPRGAIGWPLGTWLAPVTVLGTVGLGAAGLALAAQALVAMPPDTALLLPTLLSGAACAGCWTTIGMAAAALSPKGAALCAVWLFIGDMMLSRWIELLAWLTPGPALSTLAQYPPDSMLLARGSGEALAQLAVILLAGGAVFVWRVWRDPPASW